jgi:hypothetical protein
MKKTTVIFILILLLAITVIPVAAITWGQPDTAHPYVGAMVVDWPGYGPWQLCSGTLIHPQMFLTASHCTADLGAYGIETVWVNFDQDSMNLGTLLPVAQVITHPDYWWGPTSDPRDVAILVLAEPVVGIIPAVLPDLGYMDGLKDQGVLKNGADRAPLIAVGYGGKMDFPPPQIYYEDMREWSTLAYQGLNKAWIRASQNQALGNGGTCFGDSGGPIFYVEEDGTEVLVGVTSWGDAQCVAMGFYYRVDIPQTLDFIEEVEASLP